MFLTWFYRCAGYTNGIGMTSKHKFYLLALLAPHSSITLGIVRVSLREEEIQREEEKERLALATVLSAQCLAWHGWCKMWCVLASAVARLPTRPGRGTINHVNDHDPRDATAARGKGVKYTPKERAIEHMWQNVGSIWTGTGDKAEDRVTGRKVEVFKCVRMYAFKCRLCANSRAMSLFVFFCRCTAADKSMSEC